MIGFVGNFFYYMRYLVWQEKNRENFYSAVPFCPQGGWNLDDPSFLVYEGMES
jgi:hypothetical protein